MEIFNTFLFFSLGGIIAMLIDVVWWNIDYKKAERGLEVIEHYHIGITLFIAAVLTNLIFPPFGIVLIGIGFVFVLAEWRQTVEILGKTVIPGKPFAIGSKHFKFSSLIGINLLIILIIFSLVL